jgi:phage tail sheath gpL-like
MANLGSTVLVPGVYVTIDNSLANTSLGESFKTVIIGDGYLGTVPDEEFTQVFSVADAGEKFGVRSGIYHMFKEWFKNNSVNEVYGISMTASGGTPADDGKIAFTGTTTEAGTIAVYVNGKRYQANVSSGATAAQIVVLISDVITADPERQVDTSTVLDEVLFTSATSTVLANQIDIRLNATEGESLPAGITAVVTPLSNATGTPDINDAIAAIPDEVINLIVNPYTDATSTTALKTELERRWGNTVQIDGHAIMATGGTSSTVTTFGDTLNSEHFTFMDSGKDTMIPPYLVAPEVAGRVAFSADADPARPFRTLPITGMIGDTPTNRRNFNEKNAILNSGIGIHTVQNDSTVTIERLVTTYKENAVGAPDNSYQNTNTMLNLSYLRQSFKTRMLSLYPRHKLADDGTAFGAGQPIATPNGIKGNIIKLYEDWISIGLVEDVDAFAETLVVERDPVNRSRVNVNMQPILIGQLYQFDANLQFIV